MATGPQGPRRKMLLVVDDDPDVRESIFQVLTEAGYDVSGAGDGKEALDKLLHGRRPDLIILDLRMPRKSGHEVLEALRESPSYVGIPVVVLSAYLNFPPSGAVAWLKKPVQPSTLVSVVNEYAPLGS